MASYRFNYRVETTIEAKTLKEATDKFHSMELPEDVEFIEVLTVEAADNYNDVTDEYENLFFNPS